MCTDRDIKDLLPAYLEEGLDQEEKLRVEGHLSTCEDCRSELSLLRMMAGEPVPDPGDAFWAGMPARVRRAVQKEQSGKSRFDPARIIEWMVLPRWAVAAAAVSLVAIASWLLVRQPAREIARTDVPLEQEMLADTGVSSPSINMEELSSTEFAAATQWAQNEYTPIHDAITEDASDNTEQDISDELYNLSPRELDRVFEMLKQKEQDAREKMRKKDKKNNDLG